MRRALILLGAIAVLVVQFAGAGAAPTPKQERTVYARDVNGRPVAIIPDGRLGARSRPATEEEMAAAAAAPGGSPGGNAVHPAFKALRTSYKNALNTPSLAKGAKFPKTTYTYRNTTLAAPATAVKASANAKAGVSNAANNTMNNVSVSQPSLNGAQASGGDVPEYHAVCQGEYLGKNTNRSGRRTMVSYGQGERTETGVEVQYEVHYCRYTWRFSVRVWIAQEGDDIYQMDDVVGFLENQQREYVDYFDFGAFCCSPEGVWSDWRAGEYDYGTFGWPNGWSSDHHSFWYAPNYDRSYSQRVSYWAWPCCNGYWNGSYWHTD